MAASLSEQTIAVVTSTVPVVRERGLAITTRMYDTLFNEHPEIAPMFGGPDGEQEKRLAGAIAAYAENIATIEQLAPTVGRIAAKHVDKGVQPEHYEIVGDVLLRSMVEVLGEVDMAVVDAWTEAYGFLADIFISAEADLYAQAAVA